MKLHVGCGDRHIPGWTHVDLRDLPHVDVVADAAALPFEPGTADVIYACHVLEHYPRWKVPEVLQHWHRILHPGGTLRIAVPDFHALVKLYLQTHDIGLVLGPLYGRQDYAENAHHIAFDYLSLSTALVDAGFRCIRTYDWRGTEHAEIDDYSQSYYPHMDKDRGMLLSLNVEATASAR